MSKRDPRVDAYIAKSGDFAKPILRHLRKTVHAAGPEVEETLKWGFPHFMYKGILCGMAAFKRHCTFGFWKGGLIVDARKPGATADEPAMGQFGRITAIADLPGEQTLLRFVRKAVALNDEGIRRPTKPRPRRAAPVKTPAPIMAALRKHPKALAAFKGFSPSHRREYVEWITEARGDDTRRRRIETAVAWMTDGKTRNWKYVRKRA